MDSTPSKVTTRKTPFLISRNFAYLWSGQAVSALGDMVFDTTLVLWIATVIAPDQPWSPLAVSGVMFSAALPILGIGPLAGVFVDRWDKRKTMLRMDALRALLIALLLFAALPLPFLPGGRLPIFVQLGLIYAVVFLASACAQFFNPARLTIIGDIVAEPDRAQAGGLSQISSNLAIIIGPPLAAPLLFVVGVQWALILNALSFVASFASILAVRVPESAPQVAQQASQQKSFWRELGAGLRFFAANRVLLTLLVSIIIVTFGTGALNALGVFFVTGNLHVPANLYGTLDMAFGAGAILGAVLSTFLTRRIGVVRNFWGCLVLSGLLLVVYARMTSILPALVILFCVAIPITALNASMFPLLLHVTPREFLGRITSVLSPVQSLASLLSIVVAGWLASTILNNFHQNLLGTSFGPIDTIFVVSGLLVIVGGLYALINLRHVHLDEKSASLKEEMATA